MMGKSTSTLIANIKEPGVFKYDTKSKLGNFKELLLFESAGGERIEINPFNETITFRDQYNAITVPINLVKEILNIHEERKSL